MVYFSFFLILVEPSFRDECIVKLLPSGVKLGWSHQEVVLWWQTVCLRAPGSWKCCKVLLFICQHNTIEAVLQRGEKLDDLVEKSEGLSTQSKAFYKTVCNCDISCQYPFSVAISNNTDLLWLFQARLAGDASCSRAVRSSVTLNLMSSIAQCMLLWHLTSITVMVFSPAVMPTRFVVCSGYRILQPV